MNKGKVYETAERVRTRYRGLFTKGIEFDTRRNYALTIVDLAYATGHWEVWFDVFKRFDYVLPLLKQRCIQAHNDNTK